MTNADTRQRTQVFTFLNFRKQNFQNKDTPSPRFLCLQNRTDVFMPTSLESTTVFLFKHSQKRPTSRLQPNQASLKKPTSIPFAAIMVATRTRDYTAKPLHSTRSSKKKATKHTKKATKTSTPKAPAVKDSGVKKSSKPKIADSKPITLYSRA